MCCIYSECIYTVEYYYIYVNGLGKYFALYNAQRSKQAERCDEFIYTWRETGWYKYKGFDAKWWVVCFMSFKWNVCDVKKRFVRQDDLIDVLYMWTHFQVYNASKCMWCFCVKSIQYLKWKPIKLNCSVRGRRGHLMVPPRNDLKLFKEWTKKK